MSPLVNLTFLFFSSYTVFFSMALLIELTFVAFRIKNSRLRSTLRLLPFLKLPVDLALTHPTFFDYFNPFSCRSYFRPLLKDLLPDTTKISEYCLELFIAVVLFVSFGFVAFKIIQFFYTHTFIKNLCKLAQPSEQIITNLALQKKLIKLRVKVLISEKVSTPFTVYGKYIVMPASLVQDFTQTEYEAVLAHELEHLRWGDSFAKICCALICAFFWWIPTKWWLNKLENDQELSSDASVFKYGMDSHVLATAMMKVLTKFKNQEKHAWAYCPLALQKNAALIRMEILLENRSHSQNNLLTYGAVGIIFSAFLFLSFWIC